MQESIPGSNGKEEKEEKEIKNVMQKRVVKDED